MNPSLTYTVGNILGNKNVRTMNNAVFQTIV